MIGIGEENDVKKQFHISAYSFPLVSAPITAEDLDLNIYS